MSKISAVIVAHNEEKKIADCLRSLSFADEIVVVLDKCTDQTKEIVLEFTDKIIEGSWKIEGARRNVALNSASHEWIFEIDADERVSSELAQEILAIKNSPPCAVIVPIANYIGKRHVKYGWLRTLCVLSRQTLAYKGLKKYHEDKEVHPTCDLGAGIKYFQNPIIHLVDEDISDFIISVREFIDDREADVKTFAQNALKVSKNIAQTINNKVEETKNKLGDKIEDDNVKRQIVRANELNKRLKELELKKQELEQSGRILTDKEKITAKRALLGILLQIIISFAFFSSAPAFVKLATGIVGKAL
jgi:glycosyltransferase involved in cell wall biosynthesis